MGHAESSAAQGTRKISITFKESICLGGRGSHLKKVKEGKEEERGEREEEGVGIPLLRQSKYRNHMPWRQPLAVFLTLLQTQFRWFWRRRLMLAK